jgi:hypothetical protein
VNSNIVILYRARLLKINSTIEGSWKKCEGAARIWQSLRAAGTTAVEVPATTPAAAKPRAILRSDDSR